MLERKIRLHELHVTSSLIDMNCSLLCRRVFLFSHEASLLASVYMMPIFNIGRRMARFEVAVSKCVGSVPHVSPRACKHLCSVGQNGSFSGSLTSGQFSIQHFLCSAIIIHRQKRYEYPNHRTGLIVTNA